MACDRLLRCSQRRCRGGLSMDRLFVRRRRDIRGYLDKDRHLRIAGSCLLRSEEHTSELQSLMRISYAVFCLKKKTEQTTHINIQILCVIHKQMYRYDRQI